MFRRITQMHEVNLYTIIVTLNFIVLFIIAYRLQMSVSTSNPRQGQARCPHCYQLAHRRSTSRTERSHLSKLLECTCCKGQRLYLTSSILASYCCWFKFFLAFYFWYYIGGQFSYLKSVLLCRLKIGRASCRERV